MLFCQPGQARSLREITGGLASCPGKVKHLGIDAAPLVQPFPMQTQHDHGDSMRRYSISPSIRYGWQPRGRNSASKTGSSVLTPPSSNCLSLFEWATYRTTRGAVRLHLLLDHDGYFPVFAHITDWRTHEVRIARNLSFPKGSVKGLCGLCPLCPMAG